MPRNSKESLYLFLSSDIHVETRTIYFGSIHTEGGDESGVDAALANRIVKAILYLQSISKEKITIIMNTFGGSWYHGLAIYDAILACPCPVRIEVMGSAMSMGAVILQAADERMLYPNCRVMIHDGTEDEMPDSMSPKTFQAWAKESERNSKIMYQIFASKSHNKDYKYWERKCANDYILSAEQAVAEGLADAVLTPPERPTKH
jgi:ATP-dependent Clp endopeptidase proteolytic subunit ClpP